MMSATVQFFREKQNLPPVHRWRSCPGPFSKLLGGIIPLIVSKIVVGILSHYNVVSG